MDPDISFKETLPMETKNEQENEQINFIQLLSSIVALRLKR